MSPVLGAACVFALGLLIAGLSYYAGYLKGRNDDNSTDDPQALDITEVLQ
ncbi:MAG TPA: hypothetical protein PKE55_11395 [Kiritimatiellia bacterium]|nr:hypothetical protein [Kiritimatiellia bacterium]